MEIITINMIMIMIMIMIIIISLLLLLLLLLKLGYFNWDVLFQLKKAPENGANRPDIAVLHKESKTWILIEGTLCSVRSIEERTRH